MVDHMSVGSLITRKRDKAKKLLSLAPVYAVTNDKGFALSANLHEFTIHSKDTSNYMVVEENDFAYNPSRLNIGSIALYKGKGKGLISPMYVVFRVDETRIMPEYLFIVIKSESIKNKINSLKEEGARFRFDFDRWRLIQIPIPTLAEQKRIVKNLDTFTSSIDNLKTQIAERRKQYEYYRERLLDPEKGESYEIKKLGKICAIKTGKGITQKECKVNAPYPVMSGGQTPMGYFSEYNCEGNTITISRVGAYAGFVNYIENRFYCNDKCFSVTPRKEIKITSKYLYYYLKYKEETIKDLQSEGGVPTINTQKVGGLNIPVPPFSEQSRIVTILNTFEASIKTLEEQLKLRQKQYKYYRNKLITFEQ